MKRKCEKTKEKPCNRSANPIYSIMLTAKKWEVADTPGRFAIAGVREFSLRSLFIKWAKRRYTNGKRNNSYSFEGL